MQLNLKFKIYFLLFKFELIKNIKNYEI